MVFEYLLRVQQVRVIKFETCCECRKLPAQGANVKLPLFTDKILFIASTGSVTVFFNFYAGKGNHYYINKK